MKSYIIISSIIIFGLAIGTIVNFVDIETVPQSLLSIMLLLALIGQIGAGIATFFPTLLRTSESLSIKESETEDTVSETTKNDKNSETENKINNVHVYVFVLLLWFPMFITVSILSFDKTYINSDTLETATPIRTEAPSILAPTNQMLSYVGELIPLQSSESVIVLLLFLGVILTLSESLNLPKTKKHYPYDEETLDRVKKRGHFLDSERLEPIEEENYFLYSMFFLGLFYVLTIAALDFGIYLIFASLNALNYADIFVYTKKPPMWSFSSKRHPSSTSFEDFGLIFPSFVFASYIVGNAFFKYNLLDSSAFILCFGLGISLVAIFLVTMLGTFAIYFLTLGPLIRMNKDLNTFKYALFIFIISINCFNLWFFIFN